MQLAVTPGLGAHDAEIRRLMDLAQHHATMVAHFIWLYRHPYAGPEQSRLALAAYLARTGCPFPKIGHDVKAELEKDPTWK